MIFLIESFKRLNRNVNTCRMLIEMLTHAEVVYKIPLANKILKITSKHVFTAADTGSLLIFKKKLYNCGRAGIF